MIIKAEIQRVEHSTFADKKTGQPVTNVQVMLGDKSKEFRCQTPLQISMKPDAFERQFGKAKNLSDFVDQPVTVGITEMTARASFIAVRGQMVKGHMTAEAFQKLSEEANKPAEAKAA